MKWVSDKRPWAPEKEPQARNRRKVKVRMKVGEDPRTWDVDTGEELSKRIAEIRILPLKRAVALIEDVDKEGKNIIENDEVAYLEADVVRIEGIWEAR